ncbi:MAG: Disaggregatase related repeat [Gaiellaceae bacterium]|jgi:hypothetical protein|nr:Disaggregatase related repeat [Gaiellaceae bacterium]
MRAPLPVVVSGVLAAALGAGVVAKAATLTTAPARLTARTVTATVPITTCTLAPAADTYADGSAPLTAFGTATALHVRTLLGLNKRSFLRFDVASCSIPTAARLKTGALGLVLTTAPASSRTYDVHRVTASWTEATLTSVAQPATAAAATSSVATGTTVGVTLTTNVMADVSAFVTGTVTNEGWRLIDRTEDGLASVESQFGSREHSTPNQRPSLVITYYP